jgi:iron complex transport system substrate-binding protein
LGAVFFFSHFSIFKNLGGGKKKKMKKKNKILGVVEIAIVLCSVFLVVIPAIAAEQTSQKVSANTITTAPEDDYVLEIYGNANEDDTIDMRDLTYVKLIFFGKKPETELADAKHDGEINPLDFIQIKLIIVGKERELTIVDSQDKIVTVNKPINRIITTWRGPLEMLRTIGVKSDKIVGVETLRGGARYYETFFPEYQDVPKIGIMTNPDIEKMLSLNPDCIFFLFPFVYGTAGEEFKSAGISLIHCFCGIWDRDVTREIKTLGYLFDKRERAEEYIEWQEGILNPIKECVEKIPEEDKPTVYFEGEKTYWTSAEKKTNIEFAGGKTIFPEVTKWVQIDPEEVVERNPEVIVKMANPSTGASGYDLAASDLTGIKEVRDEIMNRPELKNVDAVKNGRVYVISMYIASTGGAAGCRGFLQKIYTAKWLHPDLFEDLDPKVIHQEYLTRFQGLDLDLDEKGVFAYPEPS